MKIAKMVSVFGLSLAMFILSYLSLENDGYIWLVYLAIGVVIALLGILLITRD